MHLRIAFIATAAALLAGCGGSSSPTTTTVVTTSGEKIALKVYFFRGNALVPVVVRVPKTQAVAAAAVAALLAGPPAGYRTAIPSGTELQMLAVSDGVASATFTGAQLGHEAKGQVVDTLTQFSTVSSVDGSTREQFSDLTPQAAIYVEQPVRDSTVSSPVKASGTADVFEATFAVDIYSNGKKLRTQVLSASAGTGTRGNWAVSLELPPGPAKLVFYEPSAENGQPIHSTEVDLTVK